MSMKKFIQENNNLKMLKYKLANFDQHLYLCGFIIVKYDVKKTFLRTCCVVSYNPSVFEINLKDDIKKIENVIYRYKFDEGNNASLANKVFFRLYDFEEKIVDAIDKEDFKLIEEQILAALNINEKSRNKIEYLFETLRSEVDFKSEINYNRIDNVVTNLEQTKFFLKTKPVVDHKKGVYVEKIKTDYNILCEFVDDREISKNIMEILFAKNEKYLYAKITDIKQRNKRYYEVTCCITPMIYTNFIVEKNQKLVIKK